MIEHAHEQHDVEPFLQLGHVIDGELAKLNLEAADLGGEPRLVEIVLVEIDPEHPPGAAPLHLERVEAGIAADVEHACPAQVGGKCVANCRHLTCG